MNVPASPAFLRIQFVHGILGVSQNAVTPMARALPHDFGHFLGGGAG